MSLSKIFIVICLNAYWFTVGDAASVGGVNVTDFILQRQKRFLIFESGGTIKLVLGDTLPVNLGDPIAWRSVVISYNLQGGQYPLPTMPLYAWDKWEENFLRRSMHERIEYQHHQHHHQHQHQHLYQQHERQPSADDTRLFVYTALERFMDQRNGGHGHACLLRAICENAQVDEHVGLIADVLNIVLTPGKEKINAAYAEAHEAGKSDVDCLRLYEDCPSGVNFLDQYINYW